jgi:hypothetical protein
VENKVDSKHSVDLSVRKDAWTTGRRVDNEQLLHVIVTGIQKAVVPLHRYNPTDVGGLLVMRRICTSNSSLKVALLNGTLKEEGFVPPVIKVIKSLTVAPVISIDKKRRLQIKVLLFVATLVILRGCVSVARTA